MIVFALTNSKGGVGKSTLACALAVRAVADNYRVALIDTDPQESLTHWFERREDTTGMAAVCAYWPSDALESLRAESPLPDIVFVDVPPLNLDLIRNAIEHCDVAVIPLKASAHDIDATQGAVAIARELGRKHLVVINDAMSNEALPTNALRRMVQLGVPASSVIVAHRASYARAAATGQSGPELNDKAASEDIDELWRELMDLAAEAKPVAINETKKGIAKRLRRED